MSCPLVVVVMLCTAKTILCDECGYEGKNICDANAQCMGDISNGEGCYDMTHEKLYKSSSPRNFSVYISDMSTYPENVTITVLRVYKNTYTTEPECCNLKSNETCMLPPSDGAEYVIVAPVLRKEMDFLSPPPFCSWDVFVDDKKFLKWCFIDETAPCKYVEDENVYVKEPYIEVSTQSWEQNLTYDLCLFDAPIIKADGFRYFQGDGLTYDVRNVHKKSDELCNGKGRGKIIRHLNRRKYLEAFKERARPGYTRCGFEKEIGFSSTPTWSTEPICHTHGTPEAFPVWSTVLVSIIAAAIFIFTLALVYRRYSDSWFPEYKISLQLTEDLPSIAEKKKEEKTKKVTEIFSIDGSKQIGDDSTQERYIKTPVHSTKLACRGKQEMIDAALTPSNNHASDEFSVDVESTDNIKQPSDYFEKCAVINVVANDADTFINANFGYLPKLHHYEDSSEEEKKGNNIEQRSDYREKSAVTTVATNDADTFQNANYGYLPKLHNHEDSSDRAKHFSDFNANNISTNSPSENNSTNVKFEDLIIKNAVSQACSSTGSAGTETLESGDKMKIIISTPRKATVLPNVQCVPLDLICIKGDYVGKYDNDLA